MDMIFLHTYLLFEKTENKQKEASVEPFQQKQKGAGSGQIKNRPQIVFRQRHPRLLRDGRVGLADGLQQLSRHRDADQPESLRRLLRLHLLCRIHLIIACTHPGPVTLPQLQVRPIYLH